MCIASVTYIIRVGGTISICYNNYRVAIIGVVAIFYSSNFVQGQLCALHQQSYTIRVGGTISICYNNYRVAVDLLVGQGWERKRPTLPRLWWRKTRP